MLYIKCIFNLTIVYINKKLFMDKYLFIINI